MLSEFLLPLPGLFRFVSSLHFSALNRPLTQRRFIPQYFEQDISSGVPVLTAAGRKAVEEELKERSDNWPSSS